MHCGCVENRDPSGGFAAARPGRRMTAEGQFFSFRLWPQSVKCRRSFYSSERPLEVPRRHLENDCSGRFWVVMRRSTVPDREKKSAYRLGLVKMQLKANLKRFMKLLKHQSRKPALGGVRSLKINLHVCQWRKPPNSMGSGSQT